MSEMVERAALALFEFSHDEWMAKSDYFRKAATKDVRRMIEALREPTAEMLAIRTEPVLRVGDPELPRVQQWRDALWRGMIDEALK